MSWKEIGKAINDTLIRGRLKPLNRIIEDEVYDMYYESMVNTEALSPSLDLLFIPHGTVTIGDSEYEGFTRTVLVLPNTVKSIGELAFLGSNLRSAIIPPSVTHIGSGAFMNCTNLLRVILSKNIETIDDDTFSGCQLEAITIPENVRHIGRLAFHNTQLFSVYFKGKPDEIADNAFNGSTALTNIYVPWAQDEVTGAPWGAPNATIHYNSEG